MEYNPRDHDHKSEYKIIFDLDEVTEEDLLYVENQITSNGYAKINPETHYSEGIRTWHLDWKNHGDNPQEIIAKLRRFNPDIYKRIRVERLDITFDENQ